MGAGFQGIGSTQQEETSMHIDYGLLGGYRTDAETIAQHHDNGCQQCHAEDQPCQQATTTVGKQIDVMHIGVQERHGE